MRHTLSFQSNVKNTPLYIYILGHKIVSDKVKKSHDVHLLKMTPYNKCTRFKHINVQWSFHKLVANQFFQIQRNNDQVYKEIIKYNNIFKIPNALFKQQQKYF